MIRLIFAAAMLSLLIHFVMIGVFVTIIVIGTALVIRLVNYIQQQLPRKETPKWVW